MRHPPDRELNPADAPKGVDDGLRDPVVDAYRKYIDLTLLRENLRLSTAERFDKHERAAELFDELRRAGQRYRVQRSQG